MDKKIVQTTMFEEKKETFEELTTKSMRTLFAYVKARDKAIMALTESIPSMENMIMDMDNRLNTMARK